MFTARKVVINDARPYLRHNDYKEKYRSSNGHEKQQTIQDSRDSKYFVNKNHPEYNNWKNSQKNNNQQNNKKSQKNQGQDKGKGRK